MRPLCALLQTVESVAMALHSFLASLELHIFNSLCSILEVKYYQGVADGYLLQKINFIIKQKVTYWCAFCSLVYVDAPLINLIKWRGKYDES